MTMAIVNARARAKSNLPNPAVEGADSPKDFGGGSGVPAAISLHQDQSMQAQFKARTQ
jgi:ketol-acid reductoisomerase